MATQYTTPTLKLLVEDADLTDCRVFVSLQQRGAELDLEADSVAHDSPDTIIRVRLTQAQTALFSEGRVRVQVNWITPDGYRDATERRDVRWDGNLLEREVGYDD